MKERVATPRLSGEDEIDVVKDLFGRWFRTQGSRQGVWYRAGRFLVWDEVREIWKSVEPDDMVSLVYKTLDGAQRPKRNKETGETYYVPYKVTATKAKNITRGLQAMAGDGGAALPRWIDGNPKRPDPQRCIPFQNVVLELRGDGSLVEHARDSSWLGVGVVECSWDKKAEAPTFMGAVEQWSGGDEQWKMLLQRWLGYVMLGHRKHERWMLLQGMIRGGKSTCLRVMEWLVGDEACGGSVSQLADPFFRTELATARLLSVGEVTQMYRKIAAEVTGVIKSCVGRDKVSIAVMYGAKTSVLPQAAVCMASNLMPDLPDQGRGLTGKMLVLPFLTSFVGKEDPDLEAKLRKELPGIARWAVEGAVALEGAGSGERWPVPKGAAEFSERMGTMGNTFEGFLKARFVRRDEGFVTNEMLRRQWRDYLKKNKIKMDVPDNQLSMRIETETSWGLSRGKTWAGEQRGKKGLKGLSVRKEHDDEV